MCFLQREPVVGVVEVAESECSSRFGIDRNWSCRTIERLRQYQIRVRYMDTEIYRTPIAFIYHCSNDNSTNLQETEI